MLRGTSATRVRVTETIGGPQVQPTGDLARAAMLWKKAKRPRRVGARTPQAPAKARGPAPPSLRARCRERNPAPRGKPIRALQKPSLPESTQPIRFRADRSPMALARTCHPRMPKNVRAQRPRDVRPDRRPSRRTVELTQMDAWQGSFQREAGPRAPRRGASVGRLTILRTGCRAGRRPT
jgi:hypothetical protein